VFRGTIVRGLPRRSGTRSCDRVLSSETRLAYRRGVATRAWPRADPIRRTRGVTCPGATRASRQHLPGVASTGADLRRDVGRSLGSGGATSGVWPERLRAR